MAKCTHFSGANSTRKMYGESKNQIKARTKQHQPRNQNTRQKYRIQNLPWEQSLLTQKDRLKADNRLSDNRRMSVSSTNQISRRLGPSEGWRSKRVRIAMALRQQGWSYKTISEHLFVSPKSIMRDIKCFVINPRNLPRP